MAWIERRTNGYRVRLRLPDGSVVTDSTHPTKTAARRRAAIADLDQHTQPLTAEPAPQETTLREWTETWAESHQVGAATWARYQSHLDLHILPRFGDQPLNTITRMGVKSWIKDLGHSHAPSTVATILGLLSTLLNEAADDHRLTMNPCRRIRTGVASHRPERPWATPRQALTIANRVDPTDRIMVITAAYTGMRWGEITGLRRPHCHLDDATIVIDAETGALHEVAGTLTLGPPKTPAAIRTIGIPPFLVALLREHLDGHDHDHVFTGRDGGLHRRSNFARRSWRPAADGNPNKNIPPIITGMHFHDLRHSHKTWMIEDEIPEVAQAKRLGHRLGGVRGIYSHVTPTMEHRLVDALQARWQHATTPATTTESAVPTAQHPEATAAQPPATPEAT
ncbi:MAG: site-specific integrase [Dactylosporangium sp.]|nr:site-specific integrase [Dactylosporangium sp.]NNJ60395.1 site-specific integrase [Dactylosporangium sp.]